MMTAILVFLVVTFLSIFIFPEHTFMRRYGFNVWIGIDQLINALFMGDPDETLSSRIGKNANNGHKFSIFLSWLLDQIDPGHCQKAIERDEGKYQITSRSVNSK